MSRKKYENTIAGISNNDLVVGLVTLLDIRIGFYLQSQVQATCQVVLRIFLDNDLLQIKGFQSVVSKIASKNSRLLNIKIGQTCNHTFKSYV